MKLHLPKMLFAAVAAACVHQVSAATYYLNATPNGANDVNISESFKTSSGGSEGVAWQKFCSAQEVYDGPHQLVIDQAWDVTGKIKIDFAPFCVTGINVTEDATGNYLYRGTTKDDIVIGKSGNVAQSSSFDESFTLEHLGNGASKAYINLIGTQTWTIAKEKTLILKGSVKNDGITTFSGGAISINETLTNNGSLTFENGAVLSVADAAMLALDTRKGWDNHITETGKLDNLELNRLVVTGTGTDNISQIYVVGESSPRAVTKGAISERLSESVYAVAADTSTDAAFKQAVNGAGTSKILLKSGVTLSFTESGDVVYTNPQQLMGAGVYNLGKLDKGKGGHAMPAQMSLSKDWAGTVAIYGGELKTGNDNTQCVQNINFNAFGIAGSTVEIMKEGLFGYFGDGYVINPNLKLTGNLRLQNGNANQEFTFAGDISGGGKLIIARTGGDKNSYTFKGDITKWTGGIEYTSGQTSTITLTGSATQVNGAIQKSNGTLNLIVDNSGKTTSFNKGVTVSKLEVKDGSTISLGATTKADTFALNGGKLEFSGGSLSVADSITLDANSISLKSGMTFTSASDVTLMTVTNGTLTVNNLGSWTGSTYEIDGRNYTTSLGVEDNTLRLKFTAEPLDSMDVYISLNGSSYDSNRDMLMLVMVDANGELINDISRYYNVVGIHGEGSWDDVRELVSGDALVGLSLVGAGTPVVGDGASNVGFYGSYKGEGNGQYTDKGQAIPEPATTTLSLLALCGLAVRRRRRA